MFRGEWYFSNLPFNITDTPLIINWVSKEANNLIAEIIDNSNIKKAIFVYNIIKELNNYIFIILTLFIIF